MSVRREASQPDHLVAITEMIQIAKDTANKAHQKVGARASQAIMELATAKPRN